MEHGFTWYGATPLAGLIPIHVFHALVALLLIILVAWRIRVSLNKARDPLIPDTKFSARNVFELVVQATYGQLRAIIGPTGDKYITLIGGTDRWVGEDCSVILGSGDAGGCEGECNGSGGACTDHSEILEVCHEGFFFRVVPLDCGTTNIEEDMKENLTTAKGGADALLKDW